MMCGPGGAGKTTYAKRLESEGWTRLSFEVEFWDRGITTMPSPRVVADVSAELKVRLLHHVAVGNDVVLDSGFGSGGNATSIVRCSLTRASCRRRSTSRRVSRPS